MKIIKHDDCIIRTWGDEKFPNYGKNEYEVPYNCKILFFDKYNGYPFFQIRGKFYRLIELYNGHDFTPFLLYCDGNLKEEINNLEYWHVQKCIKKDGIIKKIYNKIFGCV